MAFVYDSFSESHCTEYNPEGYDDWRYGNSFKGNVDGLLANCEFYLSRYGLSTTGNTQAQLFAHSGIYGSTSIGIGDPLALSDWVPLGDILSMYAGGPTRVKFTFGTNFLLKANTPYVIMFSYNDGAANRYVNVGYGNRIAGNGNLVRLTASINWSAVSDQETCFYINAIDPDGLDAYPADYIPFTPSNILPEPSDINSWDWMETVSQYSQKFLKIATYISTVVAGGSYVMDYSSLGCELFPPLIKSYIYNPSSGRWDNADYGKWDADGTTILYGGCRMLQGVTLNMATFVNDSAYTDVYQFIVMW